MDADKIALSVMVFIILVVMLHYYINKGDN